MIDVAMGSENEAREEMIAIAMMQGLSFTHTVITRGRKSFVEVKGNHGTSTKIHARAIGDKRTIEKFLAYKGLQGQLSLSAIEDQMLGDEYSEWLRTLKQSKYRFISTDLDVEWLNEVCHLALTEYVVWQKRKKGTFSNPDAARWANEIFQRRLKRDLTMRSANHCVKHGLGPEESAHYINAVYDEQAKAIEGQRGSLLLPPALEEDGEASNE